MSFDFAGLDSDLTDILSDWATGQIGSVSFPCALVTDPQITDDVADEALTVLALTGDVNDISITPDVTQITVEQVRPRVTLDTYIIVYAQPQYPQGLTAFRVREIDN